MVNVKMVPWLAVAAALVVMANGCGGSASLVPVKGLDQESAKNVSPSSAPIVVQPSPYVPNQNLPSTGTGAQLKLANQKVDNGLFSKIVVTVEVHNPTNAPLSGEVKLVFTDGGKATAKTQSKNVTLQAMAKETLTFEDPSWGLDNATIEVVTQNAGYDPHGPANPQGY